MREVCDPPEKHRSSQTALPAIVVPADSMRLTTEASRVGTNPSTVAYPFIIGTPATIVLSLTAGDRSPDFPRAAGQLPVGGDQEHARTA